MTSKVMVLTLVLCVSLFPLLSGCDNSSKSNGEPSVESLQLNVKGPVDYDRFAVTVEPTKMPADAESTDNKAATEGVEVAVAGATAVLTLLADPMKLVSTGIKVILMPFKIWKDIENEKEKEQEITDIETEFNLIFDDLAAEQTEIATMQQEIMNENKIFQGYMTQQDVAHACEALANWIGTVQGVYVNGVTEINAGNGCSILNLSSGIVNDFVTKLNLYYTQGTGDGTPSTLDVSGAATDTELMQNLQTMVNTLNLQSPNLGDYLDSISGSTVSNGVLSRNFTQLQTTCAPSSAPTSDDLANQMVCQYVYLDQSLIPEPNQVYTYADGHFVTVLESYNDMVMYIYQQGMAALSAAMTMEMLTNTLNYLNFGNACLGSTQNASLLTQIPSWEEGITDVYSGSDISLDTMNYQVSFNQTTCGLTADTAQQSYQNVIIGTAKLFAARMNALYDGAMLSIVSDAPLETQTPYSTPPTISVNGTEKTMMSQADMYSTIEAITLQSTIDSKYKVPAKGVEGDAILYQYDNINDIYGCFDEVIDMSSSTCKTSFPDAIGGQYYNGSILTLYVADEENSSGIEQIAGLGLSSCDLSSGQDTYIWQSSVNSKADPLLWCQRPAGSLFANSTALPSQGDYPNGALPYIKWALADNDNGYIAGSCQWFIGAGISQNELQDDCGQQYNNNVTVNPTTSQEGTTGIFRGADAVYNSWISGTLYYKVVGAASTLPALFYLNAANTSTQFVPFSSVIVPATHPQSDYTVGNASMPDETSGTAWQLGITGFTQNDEDYQHTALLQLNLPNGYVMPLYLMVYQEGGGSDVQHPSEWAGNSGIFFCPTTLNGENVSGTIEPENPYPGLMNCAETMDGSLYIQTSDGTNYYLGYDSNCTSSGTATLYQLSGTPF